VWRSIIKEHKCRTKSEQGGVGHLPLENGKSQEWSAGLTAIECWCFIFLTCLSDQTKSKQGGVGALPFVKPALHS